MTINRNNNNVAYIVEVAGARESERKDGEEPRFASHLSVSSTTPQPQEPQSRRSNSRTPAPQPPLPGPGNNSLNRSRPGPRPREVKEVKVIIISINDMCFRFEQSLLQNILCLNI